MNGRILIGGLQVSQILYDFITDEVLPGLDNIETESFWHGFGAMVHELAPQNKQLLKKREHIQSQIDGWHKANNNPDINLKTYKSFLNEIDYLIPEGGDFEICTQNIDNEIATIAGPQLVVPINNARFALNAANARWGSLYDAFYGTDVISNTDGLEKGDVFNENRGEKVIELGFDFLDRAIPLEQGSHHQVINYSLASSSGTNKRFEATLEHGEKSGLRNPEQFIAYQENNTELVMLFVNNSLHIEVHVDISNDNKHPVSTLHPSKIKDIILESAVTTIQDCEDSVAAVDAEDKTQVYRNWLGLMCGDLEETLEKQGKTITRRLNTDRVYTAVNGDSLTLSGRSLMLIRNVGHLMTNDAILTVSGDEIPEGILDGMVTSLIALYDIQGKSPYKNSKTNSVYIVKPKMHGPEEVAFTNNLFARIETVLKLPVNTLKIGIMDEERRTTVNLKECIRAVKERIIFINTGFLDRTGDEIHTSMEAGAFLPKGEIKNQPWIKAYEDWNVDTGLMCGLRGKAQIGKGMWAMPDLMAQMLNEKIVHPEMGANCAWVPSPTAATLHATHYHYVNVTQIQDQIKSRQRASLDDILTIPLLDRVLSKDEIQQELDNNAQSILGYVVRWIDQGVGCSKVPDINNIALMEDRATLRISSQHMANWLHHNICSEEQIISSFKRMAIIVDKQNSKDRFYKDMASDYSGTAFKAALDLVLKGRHQPSGYTEPLLHQYRKALKTQST